ncbi:MAG: YraN family protein [Pseudomonadota bacterium]
MNRTKAGADWERVAEIYLRGRGLNIVRRNYRTRRGEVDLIAQHRQDLVFVEVRARSNPHYVSAIESVDRRKQARLASTAATFLAKHYRGTCQPAARFDVITIAESEEPSGFRLSWLRNAFDATDLPIS